MTKITQGDRLESILKGEPAVGCMRGHLSQDPNDNKEPAMQASWARKLQAKTSTKFLRWKGAWQLQGVDTEPSVAQACQGSKGFLKVHCHLTPS